MQFSWLCTEEYLETLDRRIIMTFSTLKAISTKAVAPNNKMHFSKFRYRWMGWTGGLWTLHRQKPWAQHQFGNASHPDACDSADCGHWWRDYWRGLPTLQ